MLFEWDPAKAASNKRKHGVTFEEAASCFGDEHAWFYPDLGQPDRFVLIGLSDRQRLVFTVHAELDGDRIRIISARLATRRERGVMKTEKKPEHREPTQASVRAIPEVDFEKYGARRRNPFAKRMRREGWELAHAVPSRASLREMPELGANVRGRRNPYAKRIAAQGMQLQVGRGRPRAGAEHGPTQVKSVRLPPVMWKKLEEQARIEGVALHALVRAALVEWLKRSGAA